MIDHHTERLTVQITYLQQTMRPKRPSPSRPAGVTALMRADAPPVHFYRYLFDRVGAPHKWVSRRYMRDDTLKSIIQDSDVYIYVPYFRGVPCGMVEIDGRPAANGEGNVEIKFFGLMPEVQGMGLGRWLLHNTVDLAWSLAPKKVLIETCTADHPAALSMYQKIGFSPYATGEGVIEWRG